MSEEKEISKMKLRARTSKSYINTTQWVDSQSDGTESSDEQWSTVRDRANPTEDEMETPERIAAKRVKAAESQKKRREELKAAGETAEQTAARHAKEDQTRKRKEMRLAKYEADTLNSSMSADNFNRLERLRQMREARQLETPEETAARRAKANECQRRRRERLRSARKAETPEQTAARRAKKAQLREAETPQQAAIRRANKSKSEKRRRQRRALERSLGLAAMETPEESEIRRAKERKRRYGNVLARANAKERRQQRNKLLKETESPEEAEIRRAKVRKKRHENAITYAIEMEKQRQRRRLLKVTETPEHAAARRAKAKEWHKRKREQMRAAREEDEPAFDCDGKGKPHINTTETPDHQVEARRKSVTEDQRNTRAQLRFERKAGTYKQTVAQPVKKTETPDQTAARHAKATTARRQKAARSPKITDDPLRDETPEEAATRRANAAEGQRTSREQLKAGQTAEQNAAQRTKANECQKRGRDQLRAAGEAETPEQAGARLAKKAELSNAETPQQAAARRDTKTESEDRPNAAERERMRREVLPANETPAQTPARRAKAAESKRRRREELKAEGETAEQTAARHAKEDKRRKRKEMLTASIGEADTLNSTMSAWNDLDRLTRIQRRQEARKKETPEQTAARRAKANEWQKRRREQLRAASRNEAETPEQTAARVAKKSETPQHAAERRAKRSKYEKMKRQQKALKRLQDGIVTETPEEVATRRAKAAAKESKRRHDNALAHANAMERQLQKRKLLKEAETPARRARAKEGQKIRREQMRAAREADDPTCTCDRKERIYTRIQMAPAESLSENRESLQYDIDDDLNSSSTSSAFERPEESPNIISIDDQQCLEETLISLSELGEDPWSCFDDMTIYNEEQVDSLIYVSQDLDIKSSEDKKQEAMAINLTWFSKPLQANIGRDEHIVYCEYIAERFRKCNRSITEIKVAKDIIESIILNLSTGAYRSMTSAFPNGEEVFTFRPAVIKPIVQEIIVKEEVNL